MLNNKKGQYYQPPAEPFSSVHPVFIIGIVIFVIPFFGPVVHMDIPKWISGVGIFIILIGAALSIANKVD